MTADGPGATQDYSTRSGAAEGSRRASRGPVAPRAALALLGLIGVVLLVLSTFATVVQFRVLTTSDLADADTTVSGRDLHGIALVLVAAFALVMLVGAARGARPAMVALAVCGLLAIGLIVGLDVPELDDTGELALRYEDVRAGASTGFYLETLGGVLLVVAGGLLLILSATGVATRLTVMGERARDGLAGTRARKTVRDDSSGDAARGVAVSEGGARRGSRDHEADSLRTAPDAGHPAARAALGDRAPR